MATNPITYLPGVTGTTTTQTLPGGSTRSDYIPGVGVGNVGAYGALQSPGGNGAILLYYTTLTASPSASPSLVPTTVIPTSKPSFSPSTKTP